MNQPRDTETKQQRKAANAKEEKKSRGFMPVIWLLLAFALLVVVVLAPKLIEAIMPKGSSFFEPYVTFFVQKSGLETIALLIFLATVGNLAFRDPFRRFAFKMTNNAITSIQSSIENGFRRISSAVREGAAELDGQMIKFWIRNDSGAPNEYKSIGLDALQQYYGDHTRDRDSYLNYLLENFLDKSLPHSEIWRKDVTSRINIKKATEPDFAVGRGLFSWSETKTYNLICPSGCDEHHIRIKSSLAMDKK